MAVLLQYSHDYYDNTQAKVPYSFWDYLDSGGIATAVIQNGIYWYVHTGSKYFGGTTNTFWGGWQVKWLGDVAHTAPIYLVLGDVTGPHIGFWVGGGVAGARYFHAGRCSNSTWAGDGAAQTLGAELGSPSIAFNPNSEWHVFTFEVKIDNSAGYVKTWVDGVVDLDVSGVDTQNTANAYANTVRHAEGWTYQLADNIILGDNLTIHTTLPGECRVDCMKPNANGTDRANGGAGEMTRSTGADDYSLLNEASADTTSYVYADAANERCSVNLAALTNAGGTILAVQAATYATKNDAGLCKFKMYLLIGGTRYYSSEYTALWGSWRHFHYLWNKNPATDSAWSESAFNSAELGVERTA